MEQFHGTTILSVRRQTPSGVLVAIGGDGQVTLGNIVVKGTARKVRKLQVQFHDFVPDAIPRRARILQGLAQTHAPHWNFHFVWEEWGLKPELA